MSAEPVLPAVAPRQPADADAAGEARTLLRQALKATLATLDAGTAAPYASVVQVASAMDGAALLLISGLALHTRNLEADPRSSLLIDATDAAATGARLTLMGRAQRTTEPADRARFLARHPAAAAYADFPDFAFWRLAPERGHFIAGFGRIRDLAAGDLLLDLADAAKLAAAEADIVAHMNEDHADALAAYAADARAPAGVEPWRMTGIDPDGCDLVAGARSLRMTFPSPITSPGGARTVLAALARRARGEG